MWGGLSQIGGVPPHVDLDRKAHFGSTAEVRGNSDTETKAHNAAFCTSHFFCVWGGIKQLKSAKRKKKAIFFGFYLLLLWRGCLDG